VPSLALVATSAAALVFGITHVWREPPAETRAATAAAAVSPAASSVRDEGAGAATAQAGARAVAAQLAVSPNLPVTDESLPVFDIARVEQAGDAVIAGRAAPGAIVELLRNGEHHDQAVADPTGQFVMVPPRLPSGNYALTLRSKLPDGTLATSGHGVVVAVDEMKSSSGAFQSHAEVPFNVTEATGTNQLRQDVAVSPHPHAAAATDLPDRGSSSAVVEPKIATKIVSRGDSLWRISRVTYGAGTRYAAVYKANRERIRDPNRIYPGQIFILPMKARRNSTIAAPALPGSDVME
jgi:nucleoid-associated protein YgaU